ncbi:MAG: hypothetical protein HC878_09695 [Leptolyngbyaceae cyanobacterium SL_5_14]|nr:hypothetical protein [Leptolyngbyaceae cyanobacterium SL_5_14]
MTRSAIATHHKFMHSLAASGLYGLLLLSTQLQPGYLTQLAVLVETLLPDLVPIATGSSTQTAVSVA